MKTVTYKEVRELLQDIIDFVGGSDSEVVEYIRLAKEDYK